MKSILIAIPNEGWIRIEFIDWIQNWRQSHVCYKDFYAPTESPIDQNRNSIVKYFLKGTWDYLLMIDADNPPIKNPFQLIDEDLDIVGFPTPIIPASKPKKLWNIYKKMNNGYAAADKLGEGIKEVDIVGTGCILIARRVLEKLQAPFTRELNEDGTSKHGEDASFCRKAKKEGFKIWVAWDYPCQHYKEVDISMFYEKSI